MDLSDKKRQEAVDRQTVLPIGKLCISYRNNNDRVARPLPQILSSKRALGIIVPSSDMECKRVSRSGVVNHNQILAVVDTIRLLSLHVNQVADTFLSCVDFVAWHIRNVDTRTAVVGIWIALPYVVLIGWRTVPSIAGFCRRRCIGQAGRQIIPTYWGHWCCRRHEGRPWFPSRVCRNPEPGQGVNDSPISRV